ncbi:Probable carboxylesterase 12 [Linum perenne]
MSYQEISLDFSPVIQIHKNGTVKRLMTYTIVPTGHDPQYDVVSKDVVFSTNPNLFARIYASSASYHGYVNALVAIAQIVAISVDYRLAPEHPLRCAYDDLWSAFKWITTHARGDGDEDWVNEFVDFGKIYLAEDSVGVNIAHRVAMTNGEEKLIDLVGIVLVDPYFLGTDLTRDELKDEELWWVVGRSWMMANPGSVVGLDDLEINVTVDPKLPGLGCR